jgi:predicted nucleotide-binding protein
VKFLRKIFKSFSRNNQKASSPEGTPFSSYTKKSQEISNSNIQESLILPQSQGAVLLEESQAVSFGEEVKSPENQSVQTKPQDATAGVDKEKNSQSGKDENGKVKPSKPKIIFVVESSKETMNKECLGLLQKMGFETILFPYHDLSQKTIEERFRKFWDVSFAVVMLSGEEFSYSKDKKPKDARLRTSQTTVLELGFLLAKLGRQNTFVLYYEQDNFLLPTDSINVIYTAYNPSGDWRKLLFNRLKLAGFTIEEKTDYFQNY